VRVLGVDIGLKRTGLAMSDERGLSVRILPNLYAKSQAQAIDQLVSIICESAVVVVVIGRPEPKTTGSIAIARRADALKAKLAEKLEVLDVKAEIILWDEAMTSKRAIKQLVEADVPKKKRKMLLDGASAAILVEDFLASGGCQ